MKLPKCRGDQTKRLMSREFTEEEIDEKLEESQNGVLCRFNKDTKEWTPIEDHCNFCGEKVCFCSNTCFSFAIAKSVVAGGGAICEEAQRPSPK